jgi:putative transposase
MKLVTKLLKKSGFAPTRIVTDRLRSYSTAFRAIGLTANHDRGRRATIWREFTSAGTASRAKATAIQSPGSAQRFLAIHAATHNDFTYQRHLLRRPNFKELRADSFGTCAEAVAAA